MASNLDHSARKHFTIVLLIAAIAFMFHAELWGGAVAVYMAEEGVGTATGDISGNGNNADFVGDPAWLDGHNAASSHALRFAGADYLTVEDSASLDSIGTAFSVTAWIKADGNSTHDTIVWKVGSYHIWKQNSNLMIALEGVPDGAAIPDDNIVVSGIIANNTWLHIAVTYDGRYLAGYVNGVRAKRFRVNNDSIPVATSSQPLRIGWYNSSPSFVGSLDNIRIYDHKLSDIEVVEDMNDDSAGDSQPLVVVQSGVANTAIVIPNTVSPAAGAAANELRDYIEKATGATLGVYSESSAPTGYDGLIYVGPCQKTKAVGIEGSFLAPNASVIRSVGNDLFLAGNDTAAIDGSGTGFAVNAFADEQLAVRWLWPGDSGVYVPQRSDIIIDPLDQIIIPELLHSRIRTNGYICSYDGWATAAARDNFVGTQEIWMKHHRLARVTSLEYGHAYETYWDLYSGTHPEYFNLLPDGTRRSDPYYGGGYKTLISMNVSNPGLHSQIIDNWEAEGADGTPWINGAENDTSGKCTDAGSLAWDTEPPNFESEYGCPWSQRLTYATNAFNSADAAWYGYLGPMGDRYAKFWLALQQEAESRGHTDATVIGYAYANYNNPPIAMQNQLNERIVVAIVPTFHFPWTDAVRQYVREQWSGWRDTGASLYLRPNYTLDGHNFPIFYAKQLGEDFCYAYGRGMIGTDFDALNGQYATQGPTLYMLARIHTQAGIESENPASDINSDGTVDLADLSVLANYWLDDNCLSDQACQTADIDNSGDIDLGDFARLVDQWQVQRQPITDRILDEYYEAFGPAEAAVRDYFEYLQVLSDNTTHSAGVEAWYIDAHLMFTPAVMSQLRAKMNVAVADAAGDADAAPKVDFLEKGLTHVEMTLATAEVWNTYGNGSAQFNVAVNSLDSYRASVESVGICNMAFLRLWEGFNWTRP